ncbi:MAG TPA: BadF/BadG/BcrA/BcrD ATPase family protein [Candidatus Limnocylindrales bacterium]|nr:BadF/BadG/BcrA/BcrD ATPase family protein [Candidatus Limnocylindrales bacterium]
MIETEGVSRLPDSASRVAEAVVTAWIALGRPAVDRAVLGLTTAPADPAEALAIAARVGTGIGAAAVWLCDDAVTSHAGALSLGWGVSVVAGTGVACLAVPAQGEPRIVGGHGYLIGDEGGAFWIGREGIRRALRAVDGRGAQTSLTRLAAERFGNLDGLHVRLHDDARPVDTIARFATAVLEAADADAEAQAIVREAAAELHALATAASRVAHPGARADEPTPVGLGGRLLTEPTSLRRSLDARLALDPALSPRTADRTPLDGAMLLGRQPAPGRYAPLVHVWQAGRAA